MNPSQIGDKDAVNEYPYVVISGELILNRRFVGFIYKSTVLLHKTGGHVDAKVVIDRGIDRIDG